MFTQLRRALTRAGKRAAQKAVRQASPAKLLAAVVAAQLPGAKPAAKKKPPRVAKPAALAAPKLPRGASFALAQYADAQGQHSYRLYTPAPVAGWPARLPLLVFLHGCGQTADDFATGTGMNRLADEMGFVVAYPVQTASANRNRCWNWFQPADQGRDAGEPALIAGITRQILQTQPVDPARVYVAGLSAGGAMALIVASAYPDVFAAVGVHSGLPLGAAQDGVSAMLAMRVGSVGSRQRLAMPTIVFQGAEDSVVNPRNSRSIAARAIDAFDGLSEVAKPGRAPGGYRYRRLSHRGPGGKSFCEHWVVEGAGHGWSGGDARGSHTEPKGPDASRAMLRFFRQHRMPKERAAAAGEGEPEAAAVQSR